MRLMLAAALLTASPALAQETAQDPLAEAAAQAVLAADLAGITCQPGGYEITLRNSGTASLPEGTVITWDVPFARMNGAHTLTRPFDPGTTVMLSAVLGSNYVTPARPCITSLPP